MKKVIFSLLTMTTLLHSCGVKKEVSGTSFKFKLGAFYDFNRAPSFDIKKVEGLPKVVDLKNDMSIVKSQDTRGACTFFSGIGLLEAAIKKDLYIDVNLSEEYLIYQTKAAGFFSNQDGSSLKDNFIALKKMGVLLENDWPYQPSWFENGLPCAQYSGTLDLAPLFCFSHKGPPEEVVKKAIDVNAFEVVHLPNDINEVIKYLANEKLPVSFETSVNKKGWPEKSGNVFYNESLRQECLSNPRNCGGHVALITGYDLDKKIFFFKNSWGSEWGNKGYGTISFETIDRFSAGDYYSVKLNGHVNLPTDKGINSLKAHNFMAVSNFGKNQSLLIKATGEVEGASGRFLFVQSRLGRRLKESPKDRDIIEIVHFSPENIQKFKTSEVKSSLYFPPESHNDNILWDNKAPLDLSLSSEIMSVPEIHNLVISKDEKLYLISTLNYFSDTGIKVLSKIIKSFD